MNRDSRVFFIIAALSAAFGVAAGAFGAHALKARLSPEFLAVFETAVRYQMYHVVGLLAASWGIAQEQTGGKGRFRSAGWLFAGGTLFFSGSLYLLSITGARWYGAVTPLGGLAFIGGWIALAAAAWKK